jgi:hypothetical protein
MSIFTTQTLGHHDGGAGAAEFGQIADALALSAIGTSRDPRFLRNNISASLMAICVNHVENKESPVGIETSNT